MLYIGRKVHILICPLKIKAKTPHFNAGIKEKINMQIDPVCGMQVDETTAQFKTEYNGKTYYFCAPGCKKVFESDPERYLKGGPVGMGGKPWWKFW